METNQLKLKLASLGALRPAAWTAMTLHFQVMEFNEAESFNRALGTVAYVTHGLFKEYEARQRRKPSIINFISAGNFIVTTKYNQTRYLKAIGNTRLIYIDFEALHVLYSKFAELKSIYDGAVLNYEEGIAFRQLILEENSAAKRIALFIKNYRAILPGLKRKDMANYLHIDYDYFTRIYGKLL